MAKPDYVTEVRIFAGKSGKRVAAGSFTVADAIAVNFTVFEGKDGPRVVLPNSPNPNFKESEPVGKGNPKWYDEVRPISSDAREELVTYLLQEVERNAGGGGGSGGAKAATNDPFPF